jgi:hypothetical protein
VYHGGYNIYTMEIMPPLGVLNLYTPQSPPVFTLKMLFYTAFDPPVGLHMRVDSVASGNFSRFTMRVYASRPV